ncbi:hypothetical protein AV530_018359 [Patagioenas fasciata monilis]|uniref:Uncharacterized protein n=1 Tax=Patagioenas fasciata monilis TaxID=372326 RepID=A0A1V4JT12_PATFA|nr:hypothetical protein AV530_018359 [Patagioenas fasciata monilis]
MLPSEEKGGISQAQPRRAPQGAGGGSGRAGTCRRGWFGTERLSGGHRLIPTAEAFDSHGPTWGTRAARQPLGAPWARLVLRPDSVPTALSHPQRHSALPQKWRVQHVRVILRDGN